jgi:hypothetical protein
VFSAPGRSFPGIPIPLPSPRPSAMRNAQFACQAWPGSSIMCPCAAKLLAVVSSSRVEVEGGLWELPWIDEREMGMQPRVRGAAELKVVYIHDG